MAGEIITENNTQEILDKSLEVPKQFEFKEQEPTPSACSAAVCTQGHEWQMVMQLAPCPGCKSGLLALKMDNCPRCNEPAASLRLRTDHLPRGGNIVPLCKGSATLAETHTIHVDFGHYRKEQKNHVIREMPCKL